MLRVENKESNLTELTTLLLQMKTDLSQLKVDSKSVSILSISNHITQLKEWCHIV